MKASTTKVKKIRTLYLQNPNLSIYDIAKIENVTPSTVASHLDNKDFSITKSLTQSNVYYLFTNLLEKEIITDNQNVMQNCNFFTAGEKDYIKKFGIIIY